MRVLKFIGVLVLAVILTTSVTMANESEFAVKELSEVSSATWFEVPVVQGGTTLENGLGEPLLDLGGGLGASFTTLQGKTPSSETFGAKLVPWVGADIYLNPTPEGRIGRVVQNIDKDSQLSVAELKREARKKLVHPLFYVGVKVTPGLGSNSFERGIFSHGVAWPVAPGSYLKTGLDLVVGTDSTKPMLKLSYRFSL